MTSKTNITVESDYKNYKLAPYITLGKIADDLIAIKSQTITRFSAEDVSTFVKAIYDHLSKEKGVSLKHLSNYTGFSESELEQVLEQMVENQLLIKISTEWDIASILSAERSGMQVSVEVVQERLKTEIIHLISADNNSFVDKIYAVLNDTGLNVEVKSDFSDTSTSIRVVVAASHLDPLLKEANAKALEDNIPWLSVVTHDGQTSWVGPFFIPHKSACLTCFNLRRAANFMDDVFRTEILKIEPLEVERYPVYDEPINLIQIGVLADLLREWISLKEYAPSAVPGGFKTIDVNENGVSMDNHRVYRVPRCPDCSPAADTGFPQVWFHGE